MTILTNEPIRLFKDTDNWDGKLVANFRNLEYALEDITSLIGEVDARGRLVNNRGFNIGRMQLYPYINLSNTDLVQNFLVLEPRFSGEEAGFWIHPYTIDSGESQIVLSEDVNLQTGSALKLEASALDGTVSISSIFLGTVGTPQPLVFNVTNLTGSTYTLTEAMRIDTNYDVQIGDTGTILTSTERLHITKDGGASGASAVVIENSNSTGGQSKSAQLVLASNNSAKWSIETDIGRAGTHNFGIRDLTVNKPRMWFDASYGHLYIGRDTDNTIVSAESGTRVLSLEAPTNSRLLLRTTLDPAVASSGDPYTVQVAFGQDLGVGGVIQSGSGQQSWLLIHHLTDTHSAQLTFGAGHIDISHTYSSVRSASTSFWQRGLVVGDAHTGLALGSISPAFSAYGTCLLINDNQPRILFQDLDQLTATQHLNGEGLFTIDCGGDVMAFKRSTTTDSWVSADMLVLNSGGVKQVGASANTQGDILYFNGSNWVALGYGTSGQFLKTQGIGANPIWADEAGVGDMLKSVYDTDNDGIVDNSELVGGKAETEFALLAGRAGGQILYGGTATTEELHLYDNPTNNNGVKIYQNGLGDKHVELLINSGSYFRVTHANTGEDYAFAGVPMIIRTSGASFPVASAILELFSTTQGFLPPRMTTAQRDLIGTPVAGLIIYNATTNELNEYNGSGWVALLPTALASAKLFVGNGSGVATAVTLSGDVTNDNAGVTVIGNDKVTYAKIQNVSTNNRLLGRATAGAGDVEEITLGTNLSISGTTLNASGGGVTSLNNQTGVVVVKSIAECRLDYVSGTVIKLSPYKGNSIEINGLTETVNSETCLTTNNLLTATGTNFGYSMAVSTLYYIYRSNANATYAPSSLRASFAAPTLVSGVYYLGSSGNALNWRFVGMVRTDSSTQFVDSDTARLVVSYYNQKKARLFTCPAYSDNNVTTSYSINSTTWVRANDGTGSMVEYISDGVHPIKLTAVASFSSQAVIKYLGLNFDSITDCVVNLVVVDSGEYGGGSIFYERILSEGYHYSNLMCRGNAAIAFTVYADIARLGAVADPYATFLIGEIMI